MAITEEQLRTLDLKAAKVFKPASPVDSLKIFAGRKDQFRRVVDTINNDGQHAVIYGERGVGKTSLANVLAALLASQSDESDEIDIIAPKVNCDSGDTFSSVWKKIFNEFNVKKETAKAGFGERTHIDEGIFTTSFFDKTKLTPNDVKDGLTYLGKDAVLIVIIDEFDSLKNDKDTRLFADTIKTLSDYSVPATLVIVGVADDVDELITGHKSAERAIVQIQMPRMSTEELKKIVTNGLDTLGMEIEGSALDRISTLSQGLPHYTHLLALHAARKALDSNNLTITLGHLNESIKNALQSTFQTLISAYHLATSSPQKDHLFKEVLLACAMAKTDDLGYFQAADLRSPMSKIMNKNYDIPAYSRHLNDFCDKKRGPILRKFGTVRRFRFRFINPLARPYVIMQGLAGGLISEEILENIQ